MGMNPLPSHTSLNPLRTMRFDQVGALKRPNWLLEAFEKHGKGEISDDALRETQDRSIRELVIKQETLGLPIVTDGEHRRSVFMQSLADSIAGLPGSDSLRKRVPAAGRLKQIGNVALDEYRFTRSASRRPVKTTLLSCDRAMQSFAWEASRAVYPDMDAYCADIVSIQKNIVRELADEGCDYIGIDAPSYTSYLDAVDSQAMLSRGENLERSLERSLAADNAMIEGHPDVVFGIHLCRGGANRPGRLREGGYDAIAERMFNTLKHDRFLLEYDTERAGSFEPLRFVPKGKVVVLGIVSTKLARLESAGELLTKITEASRYLPLEQLAISAACGFGGAPGAAYNRMTEADQWRKIDMLLTVAREIWR
jgi:5-methyltetrahydropteroyltriglutamate--homocysteine methyltransferase